MTHNVAPLSQQTLSISTSAALFLRKIAMVIYRIHVSLLDIKPLIWRRVELSSHTTLKQFHRILQIVMGWGNCHLHEFLVGTKRYGVPDPTYDDPGDVIVEGKILLCEVLPAPGAQIRYVYDFGDYWQHIVELEEILPDQPDHEYPCLIDGARSCPPEDCGGTTGYTDLLEVLIDPTHEEFEHRGAFYKRNQSPPTPQSISFFEGVTHPN
jgi:hypothetical protein